MRNVRLAPIAADRVAVGPTMTTLCYLCGKPLIDDASADHLPPKQLYAPNLRSQLNLSGLITLPAHGACNKAYEMDEEYFTWSLAPLAAGSIASNELINYHGQKFRRANSKKLGEMILREFEPRPSGLYLPGRMVVKRSQTTRIRRIVWKLARGLFFFETAHVLPEGTPWTMELIEPAKARTQPQNAVWEAVKGQAARGSYGGVFEYKYLYGAADEGPMHCWGMLLWDRVMIFVGHHDPDYQNSVEAV